jgi:lipopolysaccharide exporter
MGYTRETIKGISWVGLFRLLTRMVALVRTIILARIFSPIQFGLFGIASLVLALIEILTDTGINIFLVQAGEDARKYINTAWIVSIIRGGIIGLIIFLTSWVVVGFFNNRSALGLVMLISVVPVIRGFINPSVTFFQKDLKFHREFYYKSLVFLVESIASITFAILTKNIYSLLIGLIFSAFFEVIFSFIYASPKPKLRINISHLKLIYHKGKWITIAGVFNYLFYNLDSILVGRILGTYSLGLYQMAYKISVNPLMELSDVISRVTFPVYVKISGDKLRARAAFLKSLFVIFIIALPLGLVGFYFSEQLISLVLGKKWIAVVPIFKILIVFGVIRTISGYAAALFIGFKKQQYVTWVTLVSLLGMAIFIYPLILKYNVIGASLAALIGGLIAVPVFIYLTNKLIGVNIGKKTT